MWVYLVRHAKAGSRRAWEGPDELRPLSKKGRRQAEALVDVLADRPIASVLSSPYVRCVETVQPLADKLGLPVERDARLVEDAAPADAVELLREVASTTTVLCSHGDLIPAILDLLVASDGLLLPPDYPYAKGSTWELDLDGDRVVSACYLPPPT